MSEPKKLPVWAVSALIFLLGVLGAAASGLLIYIFTQVANKLERTSDTVDKIMQRIVILEIRVDTQEKFCQNSKNK